MRRQFPEFNITTSPENNLAIRKCLCYTEKSELLNHISFESSCCWLKGTLLIWYSIEKR